MGLPDGSTTITTHYKKLNLPPLPPPACEGKIGPFQKPLISIPQLFKNRYIVTFDESAAAIYTKTGNPILTGKFNPHKNLYMLPLGTTKVPIHRHTKPSHFSVRTEISNVDYKQNLAIWYHKICCSPVISIWIPVIEAGFFATWPSLSSNLIRKYLLPSTNTPLGHLHQQYQNTWSTQPQTSTEPAPTLTQKTHNVFLCYTPTEKKFQPNRCDPHYF